MMNRLIMSLLFPLALASPVLGQTGPAQEHFAEVVDVRVVNIEAVVTDRSGVQVRGLSVDDFVLEVDGEIVPIDYFSEIRGGEALTMPGAGGQDLPAIPALVPGEPVGTSYLVFIDDLFAFKDERNRVLEGIRGDLPALGPEDRMAVVSFDGRNLEMLSSWSQSTEELDRAFKAAQDRPGFGLHRLTELRQFEANAGVRPQLSDPTLSLDPETREYVLRLSDQVDRVLGGAAATMRSFAQPPGRKVMLLVNGGMPFDPGEFVSGSILLNQEMGLSYGETLYRQVSDTANLLGYTVYPADTSGLGNRWNEDPASASRAEAGSTALYLGRTTGRRFSSQFLARETGGEPLFFEKANRAFGEVVSDTRSYYWLGFAPDRAWDDEVHDVKLRTRDGELKIRSRQGFLDTSRAVEVTMAVESAFLFGSMADAPELDVSLGEWRRAGFRKMELPLTITMPLNELTFLPQAEGLAAQIELRLAVADGSGRRAEIPVIPFRLEVNGPPPAGEVWKYTVPMRLRRTEHRALVAVYDTASGRMFTSGIEIRP